MFYYPNALRRHTGHFSTIWFAATRGIRVTRREFLKVNVKLTCEDILNYVTAQVPPPQPNLPRPRFSLYLSSQLQYGVVVVYHRQCGLLLEEIQQTIDRLLRAKRCVPIDMAEPDRHALTVRDNLYMMEEAEGAQDPFFGLMKSHQLLSPYRMHLTMPVDEQVGSQHSLVPSPHSTLDKEDFRSPAAAITLTEKEPFVITTAECFEGPDLPEATAREIDLLMEQPDHFCGEDGQRTRERTGGLEGGVCSVDRLGGERGGVSLPDEGSEPAEAPMAAAALGTTPQRVAMATPPRGASGLAGDQAKVPARPLRRPGGRRGRQLVFADAETQIPTGAMRKQIGNPLAETLDLSKVLLDLPSLTARAPPAQLFAAPCGSLPHADLQSLWKRHASLAVLPAAHGTKRRGESGEEEEEEEEEEAARGESEQDREILRTEKRRRPSSMKEMSSESGLQLAEGSSSLDVMLDMSKEDRSINDVIAPVGKWSPQEDTRPLMEPIAEEIIELPEALTESGIMLSWISSNLQRFAQVTFASLLPPEADRTTAAHTLHKLLELLSAGQVTVQQSKPYSDLTITLAGPRQAA